MDLIVSSHILMLILYIILTLFSILINISKFQLKYLKLCFQFFILSYQFSQYFLINVKKIKFKKYKYASMFLSH